MVHLALDENKTMEDLIPPMKLDKIRRTPSPADDIVEEEVYESEESVSDPDSADGESEMGTVQTISPHPASPVTSTSTTQLCPTPDVDESELNGSQSPT